MKKLLSAQLLVLITLFLAGTVHAQENTFSAGGKDFDEITVKTSLDEEDLAEFKEEVINTVIQFNTNLVKLWAPMDPKKDTEEEWHAFRKRTQTKTLELFIGNGDAYPSWDTVAYKIEGYKDGKPYYINNGTEKIAENVRKDKNGVERAYVYDSIMHPGPIMEKTSLRTQKKTKLPVYRYIKTILPKSGITTKVTYGGWKLMDHFRQVSPGVYEGAVSYYQEYRSWYGEGRRGYSDCTYKTMKVYIYLEEIEIDGQKFKTWVVKLGDVEATETRKLS